MIEYKNMTAAQIADAMGFPPDCVKAGGHWLVGKGLRRPALMKLKTLADY